MVEHGLYTIKREFLELIDHLGGSSDLKDGHKRPTYCCLKDNKVKGLYSVVKHIIERCILYCSFVCLYI